MPAWFNPRVAAVAVSIAVLVPLSKIDEPHQTSRRGIVASGCLFVLYLVTFVFPLWQMFGFRRTLAPLLSLIAAWTSVGLAITADAWPISLDDEMTRSWNLPMLLACVAGAASFYLFFTNTSRAYALRAELMAMRGGRRRY